jgi:hypothetical protein
MAKKNMTRMQRVPDHILAALIAARTAATLENASFAFPEDTLTATQHLGADFNGHPDAYIKAKLKNHHASEPLDDR